MAAIASLIALLYSAASRPPSSRVNSFSIPLRKSFGVRSLVSSGEVREGMLDADAHCRVSCLSASITRLRVRACNSCILGNVMKPFSEQSTTHQLVRKAIFRIPTLVTYLQTLKKFHFHSQTGSHQILGISWCPPLTKNYDHSSHDTVVF